MVIEDILNKLKLGDVYVSGTGVGEQAYLVSKLDMPIFFVANDEENATKISKQLSAFGINSILLNSFDNEFILSKFQSKDNRYKLINALTDIINGVCKVVVTTFEGITTKLADKNSFSNSK